jgi:hypothetical protein
MNVSHIGQNLAYYPFMSKNTAVFGIYSTGLQVEEAAHTLRLEGFRTTDISVLFPDNTGSKDLAHEKSTKSPEGAAAGMGAGAILGGALGWLAGIGALAIPALVPLVDAGPILGALAGAGAIGTVGGFAGAMIGLSVPEYEAKRYDGRLKKGGILLSVHCDDSDWAKRAKRILADTGAVDIAEAAEARADFAKSDRPMRRSHFSSVS